MIADRQTDRHTDMLIPTRGKVIKWKSIHNESW